MKHLYERSKAVLRYIMENNAKIYQKNECLLFENGEVWDFEKTFQEGCRAANVLSRKHGVKQGENVLLFLPNSQGYFRGWLGISFLGAVLVPVNPALKGESLRYICLDSEAKYIITDKNFLSRFNDLNLNLIFVDSDTLSEDSTLPPDLEKPIEAWDVNCILYTSGTTGPPKGVVLSNFRVYMDGMQPGFDYKCKPGETILLDVPLGHMLGMAVAYVGFVTGARLAVRTVFSGSRYWDIIRAANVSYASMIGTMANYVYSPNRLNQTMPITP